MPDVGFESDTQKRIRQLFGGPAADEQPPVPPEPPGEGPITARVRQRFGVGRGTSSASDPFAFLHAPQQPAIGSPAPSPLDIEPGALGSGAFARAEVPRPPANGPGAAGTLFPSTVMGIRVQEDEPARVGALGLTEQAGFGGVEELFARANKARTEREATDPFAFLRPTAQGSSTDADPRAAATLEQRRLRDEQQLAANQQRILELRAEAKRLKERAEENQRRGVPGVIPELAGLRQLQEARHLEGIGSRRPGIVGGLEAFQENVVEPSGALVAEATTRALPGPEGELERRGREGRAQGLGPLESLTEAFRATDMPTTSIDVTPGFHIPLPGGRRLDEVDVGLKGLAELVGTSPDVLIPALGPLATSITAAGRTALQAAARQGLASGLPRGSKGLVDEVAAEAGRVLASQRGAAGRGGKRIGAGQPGFGIGEKPAQGQLLPETLGQGGAAPLADAKQLAARQGRRQAIEQGQQTLPEDLAERLPALDQELTELTAEIAARSGTQIERPRWAVGFTNEELVNLARAEGRNPFVPDWGNAIDPVIVKEARQGRGFKPQGPTLTELRQQERQLKRDVIASRDALATETAAGEPPLAGSAAPPTGDGPPTTTGGPPRGRQPLPDPSDSLRRAHEGRVGAERVDEALLRQHEAALNAMEREARMFVDQGNRQLREAGVGRVTQGGLVARTDDIPRLDELFEALHNPSLVESGQIRVPQGLEAVWEDLRFLTNWEENSRLGFNPDLALVEDYFYRGWKVPKGFTDTDQTGGPQLGRRPAFTKPRAAATFKEMRDAGFEPISWNPYEQWRISRLQGERYRQQMELVSALRKLGDDFMRPLDGGSPPAGWRTPQVGPAFEGKPFAAVDADGAATTGWTQRWIARDEIANKLENLYGKRADLGKVSVGSKNVDILKVVDWLTFIPKRAKLVGSFFQQIDFLTRLGVGSWSNMVDALLRGRPVSAAKALALYPRDVGAVLAANARPSVRANLRAMLDDGAPLIQGRGVSMKSISAEGLSIRDVTILPTDLDSVAREIATETGALAKIKGLGGQLRELEGAMRRGLFEGVYPSAIVNDIRHNIAPMMARMYPSATDAQLAARIATTANIKYSVIPASQSVVQNRFIRETFRRLFFSMGDSEGLLRGALGVLKGSSKKFWITNWVGAYLFLISAANVIHFTSTGKPLPVERYVPLSKDPFGPLPFGYNRDFASPNLPFTGRSATENMLDVVGQLDTAFRVLNPASFLSSRSSVPIRAGVNQATGTTFFEDPIDDVGPGGVVSRTAQFLLDMFSPIGVGQGAEAVARQFIPGAERVIPEGEDRIGLTGRLVQATGFNIRGETTPQFLDRVAQEAFGKDYDALSPKQRKVVQETEGIGDEFKLRQEASARRGSEAAQRRQRVDALAAESRADQLADDALFDTREMAPNDWRDRRTTRRNRLNSGRDEIFAGLDTREPKDAAERYYTKIDEIEEAHNGIMDADAWDEVDRYVADLPAEDQDFIAENTGIGDRTPLEQRYFEAVERLEPYFEADRQVSLSPEYRVVWERFQRLERSAAGQRIRSENTAWLPSMERAVAVRREGLRIRNPQLDMDRVEFFGNKPLDQSAPQVWRLWRELAGFTPPEAPAGLQGLLQQFQGSASGPQAESQPSDLDGFLRQFVGAAQ